jgi:predicted NAD/FAD-dependent oxidoreductase
LHIIAELIRPPRSQGFTDRHRKGLAMSASQPPVVPTVAVIGAGMAGVACAAGLRGAGLKVVLFEKSRGVGGRMATRRVTDPDTGALQYGLDHGVPAFAARQPRFRAWLNRAEARGVVQRWRPQLHAAWPQRTVAELWVPQGDMPALARHLMADVPLQTQQTIQRLQHSAQGWWLHSAEGQRHGPFAQVMLAMPPAQAAALLAGHHDGWADSLRTTRMLPCWTLMAATPALDWPWDAAEPDSGPLALVLRNDRKPGRSSPEGLATWVAHATPQWSAAHLEDDPLRVEKALTAALGALLPRGAKLEWTHKAVHRWRYAHSHSTDVNAHTDQKTARAKPVAAHPGCWWDASLGLGVCGDHLGGGGVEGAWHSGDELADTVVAWLDVGGETPLPLPQAQAA